MANENFGVKVAVRPDVSEVQQQLNNVAKGLNLSVDLDLGNRLKKNDFKKIESFVDGIKTKLQQTFDPLTAAKYCKQLEKSFNELSTLWSGKVTKGNSVPITDAIVKLNDIGSVVQKASEKINSGAVISQKSVDAVRKRAAAIRREYEGMSAEARKAGSAEVGTSLSALENSISGMKVGITGSTTLEKANHNASELEATLRNCKDNSEKINANQLVKSLDRAKSRLEGISLDSAFSGKSDVRKEYDGDVSSLQSKLTSYYAEANKFKGINYVTDAQKQDFVQLTENIRATEAEITRLQSRTKTTNEQLSPVSANQYNVNKNTLQKQMQSFVQLNSKAMRDGYFRNSYKTLFSDISKAANNAEQPIVNYRRRWTELVQYVRTAGMDMQTVGDKLSDLFNRHFGIAVAMAAIAVVRRGSQLMLQNIVEIDTAMTELKKVTDETSARYNQFLSEAADRAKDLGATLADVVTATADFARLGYNIDQASELASAATVYKNVGDGINDISTASESIISTMKAFGIEAADSMGIVDRFNEVGNNFAISSYGIGEAMKRSASSLAAAGNTIDESIGLVVAANTTVQDPESVGTALKTLSLRIRGAKSELEDAGEDVEDMCESTAKLRDLLFGLTNGKVDIMLDEDTFKSTYQIITEMATVWDSMKDIDQAAALEAIAGKRQANIVSSMIENISDASKATQTSINSAGSAMAENDKYINSIQGHIDVLTATFQEFSTAIVDNDVVKWVLDLAKSFTEVGTSISTSLNSGIPVLAALGAAALSVTKKLGPIAVGSELLNERNINRGIAGYMAKEGKKSVLKIPDPKKYFFPVDNENQGALVKSAKEIDSQVKDWKSLWKIIGDSTELKQKFYDAAFVKLAEQGVNLTQKQKNALMSVGYEYEENIESVQKYLKSAGRVPSALKNIGKGIVDAFGGALIGMGVSAAISLIISLVDKLIVTKAELEASLNDHLTSESNYRSEVESLNGELETTQSRITEINELDTISVSDQEELQTLRQKNDELELEIKLKEKLAAYEAGLAQADAVKLYGRLGGAVVDETKPGELSGPVKGRVVNPNVMPGKIVSFEEAGIDQLKEMQNLVATYNEEKAKLKQQMVDGGIGEDNYFKGVKKYDDAIKNVEGQMVDLVGSLKSVYDGLEGSTGEAKDLRDAIGEALDSYADFTGTAPTATEAAVQMANELKAVLADIDDEASKHHNVSDEIENIANIMGVTSQEVRGHLDYIRLLANGSEQAFVDMAAAEFNAGQAFSTSGAIGAIQGIITAANNGSAAAATLLAMLVSMGAVKYKTVKGQTADSRRGSIQVPYIDEGAVSGIFGRFGGAGGGSTYTPSSSSGGSGSGKSIYDQWKEELDDTLAEMEHTIFLWGKQDDMEDAIINQYRAMQKKVHDLAQRYRDAGIKEDDELIRNLQTAWWGYEDDISKVLDDIDKELEEHMDALNDELDGLQSVYSSLKDAAEEYASTGSITVDTLQDILEYGVEYLSFLVDENGQLVINEENIQKMIAAKMEQISVETALNYVESVKQALQQKDAEKLNQLLTATTATTNATWGLVYANAALLDLDATQYSQLINNINALRSLSDSAISNVGGYIDGSEVVEKYKDQEESLENILDLVQDLVKWETEQQIDALEKQIDKYQEIIDLKKKALQNEADTNEYDSQVSERVENITKLQTQIDQLRLDDSREAYAQRVALEEELATAQKEFADYQSGYYLDKSMDALDDEADAYEKQKKTEIEALEDTVSSAEKIYQLAIKRIGEDWDGLYGDLQNWNYEYGSTLQSDLTSAWETASQAVQEYGGYLEAVAAVQERVNNGSNVVGNTGDYSGEVLPQSNGSIYKVGSNGKAPSGLKVGDQVVTAGGTYTITAVNADGTYQSSLTNASQTTANFKGTYANASSGGGSGASGSNYRITKTSATYSSGSSGSGVKELQTALNALGYGLAVDGVYGPATAAAVSAFQKANGLSADSIAGPKTLTKLRDLTKYHSGGIVGGNGSLKDNEMLAVLEKGEAILDTTKKNTIYQLVDFADALHDKLSNLNLASSVISKNSAFLNTLTSGSSIAPTVNVTIGSVSNANEKTAVDFGKKIASITIGEINAAFNKRGMGNSIAFKMLKP